MTTHEPEYFCPDCGWEGDEPICPGCSNPAQSLTYGEENPQKDEDELEDIDEQFDDEEGVFEFN